MGQAHPAVPTPPRLGGDQLTCKPLSGLPPAATTRLSGSSSATEWYKRATVTLAVMD